MSGKISILVAVAVSLLFAACSGGGGGSGPEPVVTSNRVVWSQEVPKDFAIAVPADKKTGKGAGGYVGTPAVTGPSLGEEVNQSKVVAFFASNLDGSDPVRLTPQGETAVALSAAPAPNGDFWFWTKAGVFISNINDPKPRIVISNQELATKFTDATDPGLYWFDNLLVAANEHTPSMGYLICFAPIGDEANNYVAVVQLKTDVIKAAEGSPAKSANLFLRYDSQGQKFDFTIPFMNSIATASGEIQVNAADEAGNVYLGGGYGGYDSVRNIVKYSLYVSKGNKSRQIDVDYDPVKNKHFVYDVPDPTECSQYMCSTSSYMSTSGDYYKAGDCKLKFEPADMGFLETDCRVEYKPTATGGQEDPAEIEARKQVAACMQSKIAGKKIALKCVSPTDITDYLSTKEKALGLLDIDTTAQAKELSGLEVGAFHQFDYRECPPVVYDDTQPQATSKQAATGSSTPSTPPQESCGHDVSCGAVGGVQYCSPSQAIILAKAYFSGLYGIPETPHRFFYGNVKNGNDIKRAIYMIDVTTGALKLVDQEDDKTTIYPGYLEVSRTNTNPLLFYTKQSDATGFNAHFAYDPTWTAPLQLTKYNPNGYYLNTALPNVVDGKVINTGMVSYDRKYAFLRTIDDLQREAVYKRDVGELLANAAPPEADANKSKSAKAATTSGDTATEAVSLLGDGWVLAHSKIENKNIKTYLEAKIGDMLLWESNQEGFDYLYWNTTTDPALHRLTKQDVASNEALAGIVMKLGNYVLPEMSISFDIATDIEAKLACGSETAHANYCPDPRQMCINKVCVDMFSCSATAPKGACPNYGEVCTDGKCVAGVQPQSCSTSATCAKYYQCQGGQCVYTPEKECYDTAQCGSVSSYDCTANKCVEKAVPCASDQACGKFHKCTNSACVGTPTQECQSVAQCGSASSFLCTGYSCIVKVLSLALTGTPTSGAISQTCPAGGGNCVKTYKYKFVATWKFDLPSEERGFVCSLKAPNGSQQGWSEVGCTGNSCTCSYENVVVAFTAPTLNSPAAQWSKPVYKIQITPKASVPGTPTTEKAVTLTKPAN